MKISNLLNQEEKLFPVQEVFPFEKENALFPRYINFPINEKNTIPNKIAKPKKKPTNRKLFSSKDVTSSSNDDSNKLNQITKHKFQKNIKNNSFSFLEENKENIEASRKSVSKRKIKKQVKKFVGTPSKNYLVDVDIDDDEQNVEIQNLGRPEVIGSSTKQMRHVIPFAFMQKMVNTIIKLSDNAKDAFKQLINYLDIFVYKSKQGLCFNSQDLQTSPYKIINKKIDNIDDKKELLQKENKFIFINDSYTKDLFSTPTKKNKAKSDYHKNIPLYIQQISSLPDKIFDENTAIIAIEELVKSIATIFNKKQGTAFPAEGNTITSEIRFYECAKNAKTGNDKYEVLTANELKAKIQNFDTKKQKLIANHIRIVNCEGAEVKKIKDILELLVKISTDEKQQDQSKYNTNYNKKPLKLANYSSDNNKKILYNYNVKLTSENYSDTVPYHIAKHLYVSFDFKALEKKVFVPASSNNKDSNVFKVYKLAKGKEKIKYSFQSGSEYRKKSIKNAKGYNKQVKFRQENTDYKLLAEKLVEHFLIAMLPVTKFNFKLFIRDSKNFITDSLKDLVNLARLDHEMNDDTFKSFYGNINETYAHLTVNHILDEQEDTASIGDNNELMIID